MKFTITLGILLFCFSCVSIRKAPEIESHKVTVGKDFRRTLPKEYMFIFKDTKDADEFYYYISTKFQIENLELEDHVPFDIDGVKYQLTFQEVKRSDTTVNLIPIATDLATRTTDSSNFYTSNRDNWYIAICIKDEEFYNCLDPLYPFRQSVIDYLEQMKAEYLNTDNYEDLISSKNPD